MHAVLDECCFEEIFELQRVGMLRLETGERIPVMFESLLFNFVEV